MGFLKAFKRAAIRKVCLTRPQSLWRRYVFALGLVTIIITASHLTSIEKIHESEDGIRDSQTSSVQVMLSQRILFLMRESEHSGSPETKARLLSAIRLFEDGHIWLTQEAELSAELRALYFDNPDFLLDQQSRRFIDIARLTVTTTGSQQIDMQNQLIELGQQQLLGALRQSAVLFKQMVIEQIHWLHTFEAFALLGALAVLVIEALFIFLPAQVSVSRTILRLERRGRQLTNSFEAIRDRNAQLVAARNNLTHAANHDALTGLLNRRALYAALADIAPPGAGEVSVSLLKIDLDRFKAINDSLGHKAGDDVLVEVARLLLAHGRQGDLVARIGGDEFVIAVKNPFSVQYLDQLSNRLIRAIGQPMIIDGTSCEIGASVGFTMATSSNATPDQMLIEADLALYKAKHDGRGQVCAYSEGLREAFDDRRRLFDEIGTALANDQFEPHFQPQICMETGQIYGCEILARWRHPERGIIPPATFIAAAEEAGLIRQIDLIMMEKGLNALEAMRTQGIALRAISINASEATLRDPHLPDRLLQEVLSRGLAPGDLTVEILENTLIQNEKDDAIRTVEQLTQTGFSVFLDDFGTGYASMSNLSRLQITGIKLDRSLIAPIPNPRAESIVSALVALSASLKMDIIAEGAETSDQLSKVQELGCHIVQGYIVGRPMPQAAFEEWYVEFTHQSQRRA